MAKPGIQALGLIAVFAIALAVEAQPQSIKPHLEKAQRALQSGDRAVAAAEFEAVLAVDPANAEARTNLGVIRFMAGEWKAAAAQFEAVLKSRAASPNAQVLLGMCEKRLGRPAEARRLLEQGGPKLPPGKLRTQATLELVEIFYSAGDLEQAVDFVRTLRRSDPANPDVLYTAHRIYADLANSALDTLVLSAPDSARVHEAMAQKLVNEGDGAGAIAQYREALRIDSQLPGVHYELGQAILQDSTSDAAKEQAEKEFKLALAQNPADEGALYWLGRIRALQYDFKAAMEYYRSAFKLRPQHADLRLRMGEALLKLDQQQQALEHFEAAARLDPLNSSARYRLATLYRNLGNAEQSRKEMEAFKELRQADKRIETIYQQLHRKNPQADLLPADVPNP